MSEREIERWITVNGARVPIFKGESQSDAISRSIAERNEKLKDAQIAKAKEQADELNTKSTMSSWRLKNEKFQKKTDGGVYFYSSENSIWGKAIDEKMYDKLPKHIKKSVVMIESRKTGDGNHAEIYYVTKNGVIDWYDEYGLSDFYYGLKSIDKNEFGTVSDWKYDGNYKEGRQLERR